MSGSRGDAHSRPLERAYLSCTPGLDCPDEAAPGARAHEQARTCRILRVTHGHSLAESTYLHTVAVAPAVGALAPVCAGQVRGPALPWKHGHNNSSAALLSISALSL